MPQLQWGCDELLATAECKFRACHLTSGAFRSDTAHPWIEKNNKCNLYCKWTRLASRASGNGVGLAWAEQRQSYSDCLLRCLRVANGSVERSWQNLQVFAAFSPS